MKIEVGVLVEGPSDAKFWDKVLHKHFPPPRFRFKIRNAGSKAQLINNAPGILKSFFDSRCRASFLIVDADREDSKLCMAKWRERFREIDESIFEAIKQPIDQRGIFLCVAKEELESWILADKEAIGFVLPGCGFESAWDTSSIAKRELDELFKKSKGPKAGYRSTDHAELFAAKFNPERARRRNPSFDYFWTRLTDKLRSIEQMSVELDNH